MRYLKPFVIFEEVRKFCFKHKIYVDKIIFLMLCDKSVVNNNIEKILIRMS